MTRITLWRIHTSSTGTYGVLENQDGPICITLEPIIPIIPPGTYIAEKFLSPHFGREVFRFLKIPDHEAVEIHAGNTIADTHGCILVGQEFCKGGISRSIAALDNLLNISTASIYVSIHNVSEAYTWKA